MKVPGDNLFNGKRREAVGARKIDDSEFIPVFPDGTLLFLHRDTRPVTDFLAGAREMVENGCFPGVGVSGKGDGE